MNASAICFDGFSIIFNICVNCYLQILTSFYSLGSGLKCLRCDDILEPRFCERIEYCQDGDVSTCSSIFYVNSPGYKNGLVLLHLN